MNMVKLKNHRKRFFVVRFLRLGDIPALVDLEKKQWTLEQAATAEDFRARITTHPNFCCGAFCKETGEIFASLFCKPMQQEEWIPSSTWVKSASLSAPTQPPRRALPSNKSLFGISFTSIDPDAGLQLLAFEYLYALKQGYRYAFLGSPIPGLRRYLEREKNGSVEQYVYSKKQSGIPLDPQLRYYHDKGFKEIVAITPNYFPHVESCDYGVILKTHVPYSQFSPLVRLVPLDVLRTISAFAPRFALPERGVDKSV